MASSLITVNEETQDLNEDFDKIMEDLLILSASTDDPAIFYQNISKFYFGGKNFLNVNDEKSVTALVNLWSDRYLVYSIYQSINYQLQKGHNSIYLYSFEYLGEYSYAGILSTAPESYTYKYFGSSHCDDLLYQFYSPDFFELFKVKNDIDISIVGFRFWVNFATYGNPNPPQNIVVKDLDWYPLKTDRDGDVDPGALKLLNVTGSYLSGASFHIKTGFYKDRMDFWRNSDILDN